jgi:hypothetical protein
MSKAFGCERVVTGGMVMRRLFARITLGPVEVETSSSTPCSVRLENRSVEDRKRLWAPRSSAWALP